MDKGELIQRSKDVWEKANQHISNYLDVKKDILENDYVQLLGDTVKVVGFVKNTTSLIMQKRFESFLRGFKPEEIPTEDQIEKLINYIDDEAKAEFIADTFSKIMLARSSKACLIMGTMLQTMVNNQSNLSHKDLICIHALSNFFDDDITNFNFIYGYITKNNKGKKSRTATLEGRRFIEAIAEKELDKESVMLTIEKAVTHQLLVKYNEVDLDIDEDEPSFNSANVDEYFKITSPAESLNWHIIKCGLYIS
ncbi:hypothetical protein [Ammoniphilus sp. CFH 90114]|uniref:hypothetical protein n=1 Tax=Ammoniphilus sp. CFH 90114 TaxID=2493665 RepID=UPI00100FC223|nr:hypothetical protein [Ammoniphilus sp. CFH 90114]RXT14907.1 hypothetical protein EIZ39_01465 [Ammoniphilus sp. CFH 90114]